MDWNIQIVFGVIENNLVQLASVAVENRSIRILLRSFLRDDVFTSVLVNPETVLSQIDAEASHFVGDFTVHTPTPKDPACIGSE